MRTSYTYFCTSSLLCGSAVILFFVGCSAGSAGGGGPAQEVTLMDCTNLLDDDGDGLVDCADPSCGSHVLCGGPGGVDGSIGPRDTSTPDADACASIEMMAEEGVAPVDIIWVVDSSGSMRGEAEIVQNNLNSFSTAIGASGLDYRVVVISSDDFVRVPPPLGTDTERFRFINQGVGSSAALSKLVEQFPVYNADGFLRPDAITHFVAVTDDESGMSAADFQTQMSDLLGHSFQLHSIASPPGSTHCMSVPIIGSICDDGCSGPGGDAADNGDIYWQVSAATGGQTFSICTADWSGLFATLSAAISTPTPLPCVFELPEPPDGSAFDSMRVNIVYTNGGGTSETLPNVGTYSRCGATGGWYYDDAAAPNQIVLCPTSCTRVSADISGAVSIALGCATLVI